MARPRLIEDYLSELGRRLPARVMAELADGVEETYEHHRAEGRDDAEAARSAITEFGAPDVIASAFLTQSSARRSALTLLRSGPLVGGCWALALLHGRAWSWPVPEIALLLPTALLVAVALLLTASLVRRYQVVRLASAAGGTALAVVDVLALTYLATARPASGWPILLAAAASLARVAFLAAAVPPTVRV